MSFGFSVAKEYISDYSRPQISNRLISGFSFAVIGFPTPFPLHALKANLNPWAPNAVGILPPLRTYIHVGQEARKKYVSRWSTKWISS